MIRSCCDQVFQVVDRPDPAPPSGRVDDTGRGQVGSLDAGPVGRPAGVDQQFPGVGDRGLGQAGQLPGDLLHPGLGLVPAQLGAGPQPRREPCAFVPADRDRSRTFVRTAPPAAWIRVTFAPIRRTALASRPESVG